MKHSCEVRQDNERLKRENAFLRGQLEARSRIDDCEINEKCIDCKAFVENAEPLKED